ncbi:hypothetical protein [Amphibacillus cookii]|uniref:hypothetical protein n=1 Tax=Amphibacillus cookii TaxID=767787 RepID=UPI00195B6FED|nr:hypothetical protein [Amphibacillus cookii]MBM7541291.1 hypothetical protein [Amphibacillus cookii]
MSEAVSLEEEPLSDDEQTLRSLIYSINKKATITLLREKYDMKDCETKHTIDDIIASITDSTAKESILDDMWSIKEYSKGVHEDTFIELCRRYGLEDISFQENIKVVVTLKHLP